MPRDLYVNCDVSGRHVSVRCVCVSVCQWVSVGVAVSVSLFCPCLLCVCYSASLSLGPVCLFMSLTLWVCLYLSLCVTMSVPLCVTIYPGVTALLTAQATGGRVGPLVPELGPTPSHPPWARPDACLPCLPQVNTKIRKPRATSLTSALPLSLPWTGLDRTAGGPRTGHVPCPSPTLSHQPPQAPALAPSGLSVCSCVRASVPKPLTWVSLAIPFSRMTVVCILPLSFSLFCLLSEA